MQALDPTFRLDHFFDALERTPHPVLLLDYDGTLAPFHVDPTWARPYPGIPRLLDRLMAGRSRVVIISGRSTRDLVPLLDLDRLPEIWGAHGFERRHADGRYELAPSNSLSIAALIEAHTWAGALIPLGARLERKPASLAVHWRGAAPERASAINAAVRTHWTDTAPTLLELHSFDGGIELRAPGRDKGYAVRTLLEEIDPGSIAAYLGDDLTDEDALGALAGHGLGVLVRPELRPTAARLWLRPPDELVAFLERWATLTSFA